MPGGLSWEELAMVLQVAIASGRAIGLNITIFNPKLDSNGSDRSGIRRRFSKGAAVVICGVVCSWHQTANAVRSWDVRQLTQSGRVLATSGNPIAIFAAWRGNTFVSLSSAAPMS